jgi:acetyl-CoA carboxylase biotin carboxyl carrier protein
MKVPDSVTYRGVQEILRTFRESGWTAMTLDVDGMRITVGKNGPPSTAAAPHTAPPTAPLAAPRAAAPAALAAPVPPARPAEVVDTTGCVAVTSPAVGAFWTAPSPGQPPFVQVGDTVEEDQQLAIVEVMKLMNPVTASTAGTVVQVCAANSDLVEYEQTLFWIRPHDG